MMPAALHADDPRMQECLHRLATPPYTTAGAIAEVFGVTPKTVQNTLHRWGWRFDHRVRRWVPPAKSREPA